MKSIHDIGMPEVVPHRRADLTENELDGEAVLYDSNGGRTHRLNKTALRIWRSCDGQHTTRQIADEQVAEFEVTQAKALDDVEQTVMLLAEAGILSLSIRTNP